jgi:hypothetical protein
MDDQQKPFNDAMEHMKNIEGFPTEPVDMNSLPKPIQYLGYFFIGFIGLSVLTVILCMIFLN